MDTPTERLPAGERQPVPEARLPGRVARLVERWTPEGLRGARLDPGRRAAGALAVVGLVAAGLVAVLTWHSRPQAEPVRPPPVVAGPAAAPAADPSGSPLPLVVAVAGRVRRPGVVTLPPGSRVIDALRAAGGPLPGADLTLLNLARKLADGEQVLVGVPGAVAASVAPGATAAAGGQVDLNSATLEQLDGLPGVGPVLAQRILDWRAQHGRFATVDQLRDVSGIGDAKFSQIRDRVRV